MEAQGIIARDEAIHNFINEKIEARNVEGREVPFCVLNLDDVCDKLLRWRQNLPRVEPFYSVGCNNTPVVLELLGALGTGFACDNEKEMEMVKNVLAPDQIIFSHTAKPESHIKYAKENGVELLAFDSVNELPTISRSHRNAKLVLRIAVNDHSLLRRNRKFGAEREAVENLLQRAQALGLTVIGVSFHVGSLCQDSVLYKMAIRDARLVFDQAKKLGFPMNLLDIGGGFNGKNEGPTSLEQMSIGINEALDEFFPADSGVKIIAEPGRYFVDAACTLAVNIIAKNDDGNGMFFYSVSDGIYGSMRSKIYHNETYTFYPYRQREGVQTYPSIICGPSGEPHDQLTDLVQLPELDIGEWLLVHDIGAYSVSLAMVSNRFEKAQICPVRKVNTGCPDTVLEKFGDSVSVLE